MRLSSLASTLASQAESGFEEPEENVQIMLVMLRPDAVEGFYQQVQLGLDTLLTFWRCP